MEKRTIRLCLTVDVEEEGLFGGSYAREQVSVKNVAALQGLQSLAQRHYPVTLFCDHAVFSDARACQFVEQARDHFNAEVGAHLHHWNTPPLVPAPEGAVGERAVLVKTMNRALIRNKLETLLQAAQRFQGEPVRSFRMGRWDMHSWMFRMLTELGIENDASVRPLHTGAEHPDHFDAPSQPYRMLAGGKELFEVPLTIAPLWKGLPRHARLLDKAFAHYEGEFLHTVPLWGALGALPVYHCLPVMKLFALHTFFWSGDTLVLAWHSSEMAAGATPHMPTQQHVDRLMRRLHGFIDWLEQRYDVRPCTISQLHKECAAGSPLLQHNEFGSCPDWLAQ
jgi:hypothetical protein